MNEDLAARLAAADALAATALAYLQSGLYVDRPEPPDALEREVAALEQFKVALAHYRQLRGRSRGGAVHRLMQGTMRETMEPEDRDHLRNVIIDAGHVLYTAKYFAESHLGHDDAITVLIRKLRDQASEVLAVIDGDAEEEPD